MSRGKSPDPKRQLLKEQGALNPHPEAVRDPLFLQNEFFDPRDLVQTKYEMLRRVQREGHSVSAAARDFGFSRVAFYQARAAFAQEGLAGLIPKRRGPRQAHKLSPQVVAFLLEVRAQEPTLRTADLVQRVRKHFDLSVHPRSIERALVRHQKKTTTRQR